MGTIKMASLTYKMPLDVHLAQMQAIESARTVAAKVSPHCDTSGMGSKLGAKAQPTAVRCYPKDSYREKTYLPNSAHQSLQDYA